MNKFYFNLKQLSDLKEYKIKVHEDIYITDVSSATNPRDSSLIFVNKINSNITYKLKGIKNSLIILNENDYQYSFDDSVSIYVQNPRKEYAKILNFILNENIQKESFRQRNGYCFGNNVVIGKNVIVEPYVLIGNNVKIGDGTIIRTGAKIRNNVDIGSNCIIRENSVIGGEGFGVERDNDGTTYKIPHLGGVIIKNNVEIGALTSIAQGTIEPTIVEDYVKIDDHVFIAHNCNIGKGTYIIANSEISGSVTIGEMCWIGPSTSIINTVNMGDKVTTGIGSVITKSTPFNYIVAGNPAEDIESLKAKRKIIKDIIQKKEG